MLRDSLLRRNLRLILVRDLGLRLGRLERLLTIYEILHASLERRLGLLVILVNLGRRLHKVLNHRWCLLLRGGRLELLGHHHQVSL